MYNSDTVQFEHRYRYVYSSTHAGNFVFRNVRYNIMDARDPMGTLALYFCATEYLKAGTWERS